MKFNLLPGPTCLAIAFAVVSSSNARAYDKVGTYVDWGVDEYEFFGLTRGAVQKKFASKPCFHDGFGRVHFKDAHPGDYYGPTFNLMFENSKVSTVQGIFEGGRDRIYRPIFKNKKEALLFAIDGLAAAADEHGKKKLAAARKELATIEGSR